LALLFYILLPRLQNDNALMQMFYDIHFRIYTSTIKSSVF